MNSIGQVLSLGFAIHELAQDAKRNRDLCTNLAGFVQTTGLIFQRVVSVQASLPDADDTLDGYLPHLISTLEDIRDLVEKTSGMGKLQRFLRASFIRSSFQEAYMTINTALAGLSTCTSLMLLKDQDVEVKQRNEIELLERHLQKLQDQTANPHITDDISEEENEIFSNISLVMDRMYNKQIDTAEGRTALVDELSKLYSDDEQQGSPEALLKVLVKDAGGIVKDKYANFVSHELFEATRLLTLDPPHWCCCPITACVMRDPVMVQGSRSHPIAERSAVEHWFHRGKKTCPVTGDPLSHLVLTPVHVLRDAIEWWKEDQGWFETDLSEEPVYECSELSETPSQGSHDFETIQATKPLLGTRSTEVVPQLNKKLIKAAKDGNLEKVQMFISRGANVNATDSTWFQYTALHWAATHGHRDVVKTLLSSGANSDAEDQDGRTALWRAARYQRLFVLKDLIASGANVDTKGKYFGTPYTPLALAMKKGRQQVVSVLKEHAMMTHQIHAPCCDEEVGEMLDGARTYLHFRMFNMFAPCCKHLTWSSAESAFSLLAQSQT